jgi:hypothetical protein
VTTQRLEACAHEKSFRWGCDCRSNAVAPIGRSQRLQRSFGSKASPLYHSSADAALRRGNPNLAAADVRCCARPPASKKASGSLQRSVQKVTVSGHLVGERFSSNTRWIIHSAAGHSRDRVRLCRIAIDRTDLTTTFVALDRRTIRLESRGEAFDYGFASYLLGSVRGLTDALSRA